MLTDETFFIKVGLRVTGSEIGIVWNESTGASVDLRSRNCVGEGKLSFNWPWEIMDGSSV